MESVIVFTPSTKAQYDNTLKGFMNRRPGYAIMRSSSVDEGKFPMMLAGVLDDRRKLLTIVEPTVIPQTV